MQSKQIKHSWLTLLSAFWLVVALHLSTGIADTAKETSTTFAEATVDIPPRHVDYLLSKAEQPPVAWIATLAFDWLAVVETAYLLAATKTQPIVPLPEQSRLTTYRNNISHQYYISALPPISKT